VIKWSRIDAIAREVASLQVFVIHPHPNVVGFTASASWKNELACLVMPYAGETLELYVTWLYEEGGRRLSRCCGSCSAACAGA
jgi:hypothetical protein